MPLPGLRDKEVDILRSTFRHFSFVQEVRVFGSRANGIALRPSDLDLAISSPEATPAEWTELQICQELLTDPFSSPFLRTIIEGISERGQSTNLDRFCVDGSIKGMARQGRIHFEGNLTGHV